MSKKLLENFIKNNWNVLKDKRVIFVNIGILSVEHPSTEESWKEINKKVIKIKIPGRVGRKNQAAVDKMNLQKVVRVIKK